MSDIDSTTPEEQPSTNAVSPEPAPVEEPATSAPTQHLKRKSSPRGQAVSGLNTDEVHMSSIVFKNPAARKSLSVHHMQRRLAELGYPDAHTDKDGWYGDLTLKAVAEYQRDNGLDGDGIADAATLEHLFSDDPNVTLI